MAAFKALPLGWAGSCSPRQKRVRTGNQKLPAPQAVSVLPLPRDMRQLPLLVHLDVQQQQAAVPAMRRQQLRRHLARTLSLQNFSGLMAGLNSPAVRSTVSCSPTSKFWLDRAKCS